MRRQAQLSILATVRHLGAVHMLFGAVRLLPGCRWRILIEEGAGRTIAEHYDDVLRSVSVEFVEAHVPDVGAATRLAAELIQKHQPDLLVRTTPTGGVGLDEFLIQADRELGAATPALALQDCHGIGQRLALPHPDPAYHVLTVDDRAAAEVETVWDAPAKAAGWLAHLRFSTGIGYAEARGRARRKLGLSDGAAQVLIVGSSSDVDPRREIAMVAAVAAELREIVGSTPLRYAYRPHPRRPALEGAALREEVGSLLAPLKANDLSALTYRELLASLDVVISAASVMNVEALAYARTEAGAGAELPLSVYPVPDEGPLFAGDWSRHRPSTHLPGNGSLLPAPGKGPPGLSRAFHDPGVRRRLAQETSAYLPDPSGAAFRRCLDDLLGDARRGS